jgi:hypothetical protein
MNKMILFVRVTDVQLRAWSLSDVLSLLFKLILAVLAGIIANAISIPLF